MRVALCQLEFLEAYEDRKAGDHLCYPLSVPLAFQPYAEWQDKLRERYGYEHRKKLVRIVQYCARQECDVIVFPEYSVPSSCLSALGALSKDFQLTIIAGTHKVRQSDIRSRRYSELFSEGSGIPLEGEAICPIFDRGEGRFQHKLTKSKYEELKLPEHPIWSVQNLKCKKGKQYRVRMLICSDWLISKEDQVEQVTGNIPDDDFSLIVSNTPALGELAARPEAAAFSLAVSRRAHHATLFVNAAMRGGTKAFFSNQGPNAKQLEADDGSYGKFRPQENVETTSCGIAAGIEALVIVDVQKKPDGSCSFRQELIAPVIHAAGAPNELVRRIYELSNLSHGHNVPELEDTLSLGLHDFCSIYAEKLEALISYFHDLKDRDMRNLLSACILGKSIPSLRDWKYRANAATFHRFVGMQGDSGLIHRGGDAKRNIELLSEKVDRNLKEKSAVTRGELLKGEEFYSDDPTILLDTSGEFYEAVIRERSSSKAVMNGACLMLQELEQGDVEAAKELLVSMNEHRPYPDYLNLAGVTLSTFDRNPVFLKTKLKGMLDRRRESIELLKSHSNLLFNKDGVPKQFLLYGYSDAVMALLEEQRATGDTLAVVAECRNRRYSREGLHLAHEVSKLDYRVCYISDSAIASYMHRHSHEIAALLMGMKLDTDKGVVNTVGSLGAALVAHRYGIDVVFCGFHHTEAEKTTSPERLHEIEAETKGGRWLDEVAKSRLRQKNIEFERTDFASDVVPHSLITRIITERGVHHPGTD